MCLAALEERCSLHIAVDQHCQFIRRKKHPSHLYIWAFHDRKRKGKEKERDRMKERTNGAKEGRRKKEREGERERGGRDAGR